MGAQIETYPKSKGAGGQKGIDYQVNLLALFALGGLPMDNWKLSTEHHSAGAFDDIVFHTEHDGCYLFQSKHKENMKNVTWEDLSKAKDDFALPKYYESFLKLRTENTFDMKLLILCSNIGPLTSEGLFRVDSSSSTPPFQKVQHSYRLNDEGTKKVKELLEGTTSSIDASLTEFCDKLRFFRISDTELNESISSELAAASEILKFELDRQKFILNINDWFMAKRGIFIIKSHVKAFLYEHRSQKYSKELDSHDIHFRDDYDIDGKKIVNIISRIPDFLNILKVHRSLQKKYEETKILFIHPGDDMDVILNIIESFELPRFEILVISLYKFEQSEKLCLQIDTILTNFSYKKAVITSKESLQQHHFSLHQLETIDYEIKFTDLDPTSQKKLLSKSVDFQGRDLSMKDLIDNTSDDINSIIDHITIADLILDKEIKIGSPIEDLGDLKQYYVNRKFSFETNDGIANEFEEQDFSHFLKQPGKFVLISNVAGMGKTTFLTRLGCLLKSHETTRTFFIIRIELNMFTSIFKHFQKTKKTSIKLEQILGSEHEKGFGKNIFTMTNKVILMVDAIDEISPTYTRLVENFLIETSKRDNIFKIFVTTRPHLSMDLHRFLSTKSYQLHPFSDKQQIDFLRRYWEEKLKIEDNEMRIRCRTYTIALLRKIEKSIGKTSWKLIGIPLQTKMIAEIFQGSDEKEYDWVCCKDFLVSKRDDLKLADGLNITRLYDMFMEKKREIFIDDKCNSKGNAAAEDIFSNQYEIALKEHQKLAAHLLFEDHGYAFMNISQYIRNTSDENLTRMGVVQKNGDDLKFVHQTFAEYFVAKTLWLQLDAVNHSNEFMVFLLSFVFVEVKFEVIRAFFESLLINEFDKIRDDIFEVCGSTVDSICWGDTKNINILGREGRLHILKLMLEKSTNATNREKLLNVVDKWKNETILFAASEFPEIIKFLSEKGANIKQRDEFDRTILIKAARACDFELVKYLVERGADVNFVDNYMLQRYTPLMWSIHHHSKEIFFYLLENGADVNVGSINTALITAVTKRDIQMVQELIERGAVIEKKTTFGITALNRAAEKGFVEILRLLLQKFVNVDEQDNNGDTAAHHAVANGHLDCLKILIDRGANVYVNNSRGMNILELAAHLHQEDIVDYLSTDVSFNFDR